MATNTRPWRRRGARLPVYVMRRFFNCLVGKSDGVQISSVDNKLHTVSVVFPDGASASAFYHALQTVYRHEGEA